MYRYVHNQPTVATDPSGSVFVTNNTQVDIAAAGTFIDALKSLGAEHVSHYKVGKYFYIHTDNRDIVPLFKFANRLDSKTRRKFLYASGAIGEHLAKSSEYILDPANAFASISLGASEKDVISQRQCKLKMDKYAPKLVLDLGGEGRYFEEKAINLNRSKSKQKMERRQSQIQMFRQAKFHCVWKENSQIL